MKKMKKIYVFAIMIVFILASQPCLAIDCPDFGRFIKDTDSTHKTWKDLHRLFSTAKGCDDGAYAEGYSDFVAQSLAKHWERLSELVTLTLTDSNFHDFVLKHIDATADPDDIAILLDNAQKRCPSGSITLCKEIEKAALSTMAIFDTDSLLNKVDTSHPYYGKKVFGSPKVNLFRLTDKSKVLIYQAKYGGDGEHSENILKLFKFQDGKVLKLLDQNIDFVEFVEENGTLKQIKGKYVESLCNVCDGWDVASPDDVFFIPIVIDVESLTVRPDLTKKQKQELLARLEERSNKDLAEQLSYGNKTYPAFAASVKKRVNEILGQ